MVKPTKKANIQETLLIFWLCHVNFLNFPGREEIVIENLVENTIQSSNDFEYGNFNVNVNLFS